MICIDNCDKCLVDTHCEPESCVYGYHNSILNDRCIEDCTFGFYEDAITRDCDACIEGCAECSNPFTCNVCYKEYHYVYEA